MAKIAIMFGSIRRESKGVGVPLWIKRELLLRGHEVEIIDPRDYPDMQVLTDQYKTAPNPSEQFTNARNIIVESDGYIIVSPEYNHGYSGAIKNIIDCFLEEYFFKPFSIVTYSSSALGGVRAAEKLRPVISEIGGVSTPTSLQIPTISKSVTGTGELLDETRMKAFNKMISELEWYMSALSDARAKGTPY
jgi:NAD(P)H-dependent FMN reductase